MSVHSIPLLPLRLPLDLPPSAHGSVQDPESTEDDECCTVLVPVSLVVHMIGFLGCVIVFNCIGEYCESIPLNRTGSYVLSA